MRVLIVQNEETESLGLYEQFLSEEGMGLQVVHAYGIKPDAPFPLVDDFDAFIIGPTPSPWSSRPGGSPESRSAKSAGSGSPRCGGSPGS